MTFLFIGLVGFYYGKVYHDTKFKNALDECIKGYNRNYQCKMR